MAVSVRCPAVDYEPEERERPCRKRPAESLVLYEGYGPSLFLGCLADDSGSLPMRWRPSRRFYSARYAGPDCDDEANNEKLIAELSAFPPEKRTVHYIFVRWSSSGPSRWPYRTG